MRSSDIDPPDPEYFRFEVTAVEVRKFTTIVIAECDEQAVHLAKMKWKDEPIKWDVLEESVEFTAEYQEPDFDERD